MSGGPRAVPRLDGVRQLLTGARMLGGPLGTTLELSILTLGLAWEVVEMRLENIDWADRSVRVPRRGGRHRTIALSGDAQATLLRTCGSAGGAGQIVTGGRGPELDNRDVRLRRLREALGAAHPPTLAIDWNFHGLRTRGATELMKAGCSSVEVRAALGLTGNDGGERWRQRFAPIAAGAVLERWSRILRKEV